MDDNKFNYAILKINADGNKGIEHKFYAANDDEAKKFLDENYPSKDGIEYCYSTVDYYKTLDDDGNLVEKEHIHGIYEPYKEKESMKEKMKDFFEYCICDKLRRAWWWMTDLVFLNKNKIEKHAFWSFDSYMLEMILKVVPELAEHSHGVAEIFVSEAMEALGKTDPEERDTKETVDKAVEIMKKHYYELVDHVKLYDYYSGHGSCHLQFIDREEFEEQYKSKLPLKPGSYKIFDYVKLNHMAQREWNAIWDWMKKYGQALWD